MNNNILMKGLTLLLCLCSGCGIGQTISLIDPPGRGINSDINQTISFTIPDYSTIQDNFKGIEVYYKLFNDVPVGLHDLSVTEVTNQFYRIHKAVDNDRLIKPVLSIPYNLRDAKMEIVISFKNLDVVVAAGEGGGEYYTSAALLREAKNTDGNFKAFDELDSEDDDYRGITAEKPYIALYVFSYGISDDLAVMRSKPVYLGYIQIYK